MSETKTSHITGIMNPACYHGHGLEGPFFEGWYYKIVSADGAESMAIIPGIYKGDAAASHAFIQVLDARAGRMHYEHFEAGDFLAAGDGVFDVRLGKNRFHEKGLILDIDHPDFVVSGQLDFSETIPWPVRWQSPGIMGWYAWMPFMQCYHGVVSLDHEILGQLALKDRTVSYDHGRGYTEKDWGRSFPQSWIWLQSNHFGVEGTSLTASIAHIPWLGTSFPGFIIGFWHHGELHRFTTYTRAKVEKLRLEGEAVEWVVRRGNDRLEMFIKRGSTVILKAPTSEGMTREIPESLHGSVEVRFSRKGKEIFSGTGTHAGLEVVNVSEAFLKSVAR